jgi:hypothetical protein
MTQIVFEGRTADPAIIYTAVIKACRVRAKNGSYILLSVKAKCSEICIELTPVSAKGDAAVSVRD